MYMHTYMRTYLPDYIETYMYTHIYLPSLTWYKPMNTQTNTHTHTNTCTCVHINILKIESFNFSRGLFVKHTCTNAHTFALIYKHTSLYTHMHTHIPTHTYTHTHIHTHTHSHTHTCVHADILKIESFNISWGLFVKRTCTHAHTFALLWLTRIHTNTHTDTHTHTHTHIHTHTHTHSLTYTCIHTDILKIQSLNFSWGFFNALDVCDFFSRHFIFVTFCFECHFIFVWHFLGSENRKFQFLEACFSLYICMAFSCFLLRFPRLALKITNFRNLV